MKLLIVDDDALVLRALERMLGGDHDVTLAMHPLDALALVTAYRFDAALVDLHLKEKNGITLRSEMIDADPNLKVILITGCMTRVDEEMAKGAPYIEKPFLLKDINSLLLDIVK